MGLPGGPRRPNTTAYFVALAGILILIVLLFCYFIYFCIKKVKEVTREDSPLNEPSVSTPARTTYPVQQGVRDSATAMAKLCKQLPSAGKGGTVFPLASSPAATRAGAAGGDQVVAERGEELAGLLLSEVRQAEEQDGNKVPAPSAVLEGATISAS